MSYVNMDHAGWVERQIEAARSMHKKPKRNREGKVVGWHQAPEKLSPFQIKVMNILGIVGGGIYNAPITWESVDWQWGHGLSVIWRGDLATFDFMRLTNLVFLCHDARIRCDVSPSALGYLRLSFWQRSHVGGSNGVYHPDLAEAVARHRASVPLDHSIAYRAPVEADVAEIAA